MSKLREDILFTMTGDSYGEALRVHGEAKTIADDLEPLVKKQMLETFGKALRAKSVEEMAETFRKEVEAL